MASRILVLHGPNLPRLLEREAGTSLSALEATLAARAREKGAEVRSVHSAHEGGLVDALEAAHGWVEAVLVSPGVLAHTSYALREALELLGVPAVEVQLMRPTVEEPWRRVSLLTDVVAARFLGLGQESYLEALDVLLSGGHAEAAPDDAQQDDETEATEADSEPPAPRTRKTLGRRAPAPPPKEEAEEAAAETRGAGRKTLGRTGPAQPSNLLTRALVRQKIGERLSGALPPEGLAAWARTQWLAVQGGAPAETGQREVLEEALQALTLSAAGPSRMNDVQLLELMARLDR